MHILRTFGEIRFMQPTVTLCKIDSNTRFVFYNLILIMHFQMVLHVSALFPVENRAETCSTNLNVIIETELGKKEVYCFP